jgi:uncharacterized SAM-binding protein YcdF (DUF218 family)
MRGILETLAIPPTCFVILIVVGLILQQFCRRFGLGLAWVSVISLILMGMPIVSHNLLLALETNLPATAPTDHPPSAIVVLGAEVIRARTEKLGIRPGPLTLERLRGAVALARRTGLPILVTGGPAQLDSVPVATVMAASLSEDFRTPARWVEDKSRDTWENARFSADILRREGITSVYVMTSAWHMRRALLAFQGTGLTVTAAPTPLDDPLAPNLDDFLPRPGVWLKGYCAMHEWIGYEWYMLR